MTDALVGLVLGLAGSGHCAGMCGPLVLFSNTQRGGRLARHAVLHHTGRLAVYLLLASLAGVAGSAAAAAGWRSALAIASGAALLINAIGLATLRATSARGPGRLARRVSRALALAARTMRRHPTSGALVFGAFNGLLPCGLVYAALGAALGLGDFGAALAFVAAFGVGTLPVFAALTASAEQTARWLPARARRLAPVALALVGALLVARGVMPATDHDMSAHNALHLHDE